MRAILEEIRAEFTKQELKSHGWSLWGDLGQALGFDNEHSKYNQEKKAAQRSRDYSSMEAAKLRKWQEDLSNNAIQRQQKQYREAGINPILAANGVGAAVPSGAMGSVGMEHIKTGIEPLINAFGSIMGAKAIGKGISGRTSEGEAIRAHQATEGRAQRLHQQRENQLNREANKELHSGRLSRNAKDPTNWRNLYN